MVKMRRTILIILVVVFAAQPAASNDTQPEQRIRSTFGLALGSPAGFNFFYTHVNDPSLGFRVSGGFIPNDEGGGTGGLQVNLLRSVRGGRDYSLEESFILEYTSIGGGRGRSAKTWLYIGLAGSIRWKALFLEIGLTAGSGSYTSPQAVLQLGVVLHTSRCDR
ncbi:MAG: hypothetical protein OEV49_08580 [candidate division Zixibacteria bacterium]|nr:hypothetical protein [candidate division Zixibacteria bacterium]MDH3936877.1 hypothetical protein [candidate division Zixibacteria bacterium]MDH4033614.1 hypothetical protein [candidate division Zixibacteria bacterium]